MIIKLRMIKNNKKKITIYDKGEYEKKRDQIKRKK
jgi:hypothetical protein